MGYYRKLQHEGYLRHLLVRRAVKTGEILVALVTSGQTGKEGMPQSLETEKVLLEEWKKTLLALKMEGSFAGILHIRMILWQMWYRAMKLQFFMEKAISMKNCWA